MNKLLMGTECELSQKEVNEILSRYRDYDRVWICPFLYNELLSHRLREVITRSIVKDLELFGKKNIPGFYEGDIDFRYPVIGVNNGYKRKISRINHIEAYIEASQKSPRNIFFAAFKFLFK